MCKYKLTIQHPYSDKLDLFLNISRIIVYYSLLSFPTDTRGSITP